MADIRHAIGAPWVITYLEEVADRVLKSDLNKAVTALGIRSPKKSWLKAAPLIREWEDRKENPEATDLARYWGVTAHEREVIETEVGLEIYKRVAEEDGIRRIDAREKIAADSGYSSESSHRRGIKRRLQRIRS